MKTGSSLFRLAWIAFLLCILISGAPILGAQPGDVGVAPAKAAAVPVPTDNGASPGVALVFFSQHKMPEAAWTALFAAMRARLPEAAAEVPTLDAHVKLIRGDRLARETVVPESVTVYLHGDCQLYPMAQSMAGGERLGWVMKVGSRIEPVIHVECTPIGRELSQNAEWMSSEERMTAMSAGLTEVILHEWAHVATQSSAHAKNGITKARFSVDDLVMESGLTQACSRQSPK
jgi:hypothetical protein